MGKQWGKIRKKGVLEERIFAVDFGRKSVNARRHKRAT